MTGHLDSHPGLSNIDIPIPSESSSTALPTLIWWDIFPESSWFNWAELPEDRGLSPLPTPGESGCASVDHTWEDKLGAGRHRFLLHSPTATGGPPREALAPSHLQGFLSPPALSIPSFIKEGG